MKTIVILQPGYLPWLGFFEQLYRSDVFVIYDDVPYDKNGWRNRNRIKTSQGIRWLSVPVLAKGRIGQLICDAEIDQKVNWQDKHIKGIELNYARAPFFQDYFPPLRHLLEQKWARIVDLDVALIRALARMLGIHRQVVQSSELRIQGERIERLIKICQHFEAGRFYEGESGKDYIPEAEFHKQNIQIEFQRYEHPHYSQLYGDFISHLSAIDLLFNEGLRSLDILLGATHGVLQT